MTRTRVDLLAGFNYYNRVTKVVGARVGNEKLTTNHTQVSIQPVENIKF